MCLSAISTTRSIQRPLLGGQADAPKITRERRWATVGTLLVVCKFIKLDVIGLIIGAKGSRLGFGAEDRGASGKALNSLCGERHRSLLLHELLLQDRGRSEKG